MRRAEAVRALYAAAVLLLRPADALAVNWRTRFDAVFLGDFENTAQIVAERARGVAAADRDGHEEISCRLRPLTPTQAAPLVGADAAARGRVVLASYALDGDATRAAGVRPSVDFSRGAPARDRSRA